MGLEDRDYHKQKQKELDESYKVRLCPSCKGFALHLTHSNSSSSNEGDVFSCSYCKSKYRITNGHLIELK
jgi:RNase P subunit RPR2